MKKPCVVAISAVSGGGKTTAIELLNEKLANSKVLFFDDYDFKGPENYIEWVRRGGDYNEWHLEPLVNDLNTILDNKEHVIEYILLDFPFAYLNHAMRELIDIAIFIDTPLDVAMARRILRDQISIQDVIADSELYLSGAREAYMQMLKTVKPNSDIVIDGLLRKEILVEEIMKNILESI